MAVPLCPPISASTEVDDGSDEGEVGDWEIPANGKESNNKKRWERLGCGRASVLEISEGGDGVEGLCG